MLIHFGFRLQEPWFYFVAMHPIRYAIDALQNMPYRVVFNKPIGGYRPQQIPVEYPYRLSPYRGLKNRIQTGKLWQPLKKAA